MASWDHLMAAGIDYDAVLKHPKVRKALGRRGLAKAAKDEDYLPNLILDEAEDVLTLAWDGDFPGNSGANYLTRWHGLYFLRSSDLDPAGPFASLDQALDLECFAVPTANPQLWSKVLPLRRLLSVAQGLLGEEGESVVVNDRPYVLRGGKLVPERSAAGE